MKRFAVSDIRAAHKALLALTLLGKQNGHKGLTVGTGCTGSGCAEWYTDISPLHAAIECDLDLSEGTAWAVLLHVSFDVLL